MAGRDLETPGNAAAGEAVTGGAGYRLAVRATLAFALALATAAPVFALDNLFAVAKGGTASEVSAAIAAGADPNARNEGGVTPLHGAAMFNPEPSVVAALTEVGADPNARGEGGVTPLHAAAMFNPEPSVVRALIEAGADVNARDIDGKTPFDYAKDNEALRGTEVYWRSNEARFR